MENTTDFLFKQLPVAGIVLLVVWFAYKAIREQQKDFLAGAERQQQIWKEFVETREEKVESAMVQVASELKEVSRQNRISNRLLMYQTINNPEGSKKPKSRKVDDLEKVIGGDMP